MYMTLTTKMVILMMNDRERYISASWFCAGVLYGERNYERYHADSAIPGLAEDCLERYDEGRCINCNCEVELLDGFFCGRCIPPNLETLVSGDD